MAGHGDYIGAIQGIYGNIGAMEDGNANCNIMLGLRFRLCIGGFPELGLPFPKLRVTFLGGPHNKELKY